MKRIVLLLLIVKGFFFIWYFLFKSKSSEKEIIRNRKNEIEYDNLTNKIANISKLEECKVHYPFVEWRRKNTEYGMSQYTQENCESIELIFDELIADLKVLPSDAKAEDKVLLFKYAVMNTNILDNRINGLIETGEREDLCELFDHITIAAGLEPEEFADGEGIADEWREW